MYIIIMELQVEYEEPKYKYIYCVDEFGKRNYYLNEIDTRYTHDRGGVVIVIRCRENDLIYAKAKRSSFNW
jgi:hypothetical protein